MMRILRTGTWNSRGFTLIELLTVIALLGVMLLSVFPNLPIIDEVEFRREARRIAGTLRYLNELAAIKKVYYRVWFILEDETIIIESSKDGLNFAEYPETPLRRLKEGLEIDDITLLSTGRVTVGKVAVTLSPSGPWEAFVLHLKKGKKHMTLSINPSGRVRIEEGYVI